MSNRDEPELLQYTGFERKFCMPFDRELNGEQTLASIDSITELVTSALTIDDAGASIVASDVVLDDRTIYANKAIQVDIDDLAAVEGESYRVKFVAVDSDGNKIPLVGKITILP